MFKILRHPKAEKCAEVLEKAKYFETEIMEALFASNLRPLSEEGESFRNEGKKEIFFKDTAKKEENTANLDKDTAKSNSL